MPPEPDPQRPLLAGRRLLSGLSIASKASVRSYATSSFEADDERSSSNGSDDGNNHSDMNPASGDAAETHRADVPAYSGQDARPTSRKELAGWFMYAFAAETYVVCGIGSFIPILLETLARENGHLLSDPSKPCGASDSQAEGQGQCILYIAGIPINTASFAMYTFSASVLLQALLVVSISCYADHGNYRKKLLLVFGWIGSFSVMAFIFISEKVYLLGAIFTIISNTSFGASFVLLNSFLPLLVRYHPEVLDVQMERPRDLEISSLESQALADSVTVLLPGSESDAKPPATFEEVISKELSVATRISAQGMGSGYSAGLFVQCLSIGILVALKSTTWSLRLVLFFCGAWWAVFTIPAALWLRPRPGPPLGSAGRKGRFPALAYVKHAWKSLFKTVMLARQLKDIVLFLGGWFLLSDAIATTSSTAILFAKTELHMKPWALGIINVIATMMGLVGAFGWPLVSKHFGLKTHQTILVCIGLFELIPLYGLLGYLPFVESWGVIGLQQPWEMYPLAAIYGLVMGGLSSYCRGLFGELIPPGSEAAFYALYAITDKGSSVFGPTIVGIIMDKAGNIRPSFWFLAALIGLPAPLVYFINVERGKIDGANLAKTIEGVADEREEAQRDEEAQGMLDGFEAEEEDVESELRRRS